MPSTGSCWPMTIITSRACCGWRTTTTTAFARSAGPWPSCWSTGAARSCSWTTTRSEERRVGKECRSRWSAYQYKIKDAALGLGLREAQRGKPVLVDGDVLDRLDLDDQ